MPSAVVLMPSDLASETTATKIERALASVARQAGLQPHLLTQGEFLLRMGLLERAGQLGAKADEGTRERIRGEVERLAGPQEMGDLFKVMAVLPAGMRVEPFLD